MVFYDRGVLLKQCTKFQRANAEATRKILKKHAKRTALPLPSLTVSPDSSQVPSSTSLTMRYDTSAFSLPGAVDSMTLVIPRNIASLPRTLVQAMSETLLPIIPHVDDYACLICTSIAFKPIRLFCGHLFCVRYVCSAAQCMRLMLLIIHRLFRCLVKMQKRGKGNCPMCRAPTVLQADRCKCPPQSRAALSPTSLSNQQTSIGHYSISCKTGFPKSLEKNYGRTNAKLPRRRWRS